MIAPTPLMRRLMVEDIQNLAMDSGLISDRTALGAWLSLCLQPEPTYRVASLAEPGLERDAPHCSGGCPILILGPGKVYGNSGLA